ncbi:MAG: ATP-binding cassette domain-containing protein [Chitinivibrionales bacterium]|nr:ATP-binding cassette domain-containing protein [Chitinivibrionales bacterium]
MPVMDRNSNCIVVDSLTKRFGRDAVAIDGISFSVGRGEIFGLLGPNGAGKTTTVRILTTLLKPSGGTCFVCGLDTVKDAAAIRRRIGYVSQHATVDTTLTGLQNLLMQARFFHIRRGEAARRCAKLLELAGLSQWADKKVSIYSGGMRRRLDVAAGFVNNPEVLFLDEPTLGLDTQARAHIWEYVGQLRDSFGSTVLLTTHYMHEADALCDRIALLDKGTIKALDSPAGLKEGLGGDCVYIKLGQEDYASIPDAVTSLSAQADIRTVSAVEEGLACVCSGGDAAIAPIMHTLHSLGLFPASVTLKKTTLDDVYLSLTGKSYCGSEAPRRNQDHGHPHRRHG